MTDKIKLHFKNIFTQAIEADWLAKTNTKLHVMRLDLLHPVISGNKWFKLKYYLQNATQQGFRKVGTFGGAFSNHIIATAYACHFYELKSTGIIRGEQPKVLSHTLRQAHEYGMDLHFISRSFYKEPEKIKKDFEDVYWINEGGYGKEGAKGAAEILSFADDPENYSHIVCAAGTGTMMAGLIQFAMKQEVIGISVLKGNYSLEEKVNTLLREEDKNKAFRFIHEYHFGGYAKDPPALIDFMNEVWQHHDLPTDFVYTAKTFYAVQQLIIHRQIPPGSNVLMIHSGGLQGNLSLPGGALSFL